MKLLLVHPGASFSTADVDAGLRYGLEQHGADVIQYRLDARIERSKRWLISAWRSAKKKHTDLQRPTTADIFYQAGIGALEQALRHQVDVVFVISAMFLHPDVIVLMKRAGLRVVVLFTESPYDTEKELGIARLVDGCWTNERSALDLFRRINPNTGYLPHAWHPERHQPGRQDGDEGVPVHDVVFVGTAFEERIAWLSAIDWTGIDLGLYGNWTALPSKSPLRQYVQDGTIHNAMAGALYRRARIGLNLYRTSMGFGPHAPHIAHAESLNPRAYELAACGAFSLSTYRAEIADVFGDRVPTFTTAGEASALIRHWLAQPAERARVSAELPACVAESSWAHRASQVIRDLHALLGREVAA